MRAIALPLLVATTLCFSVGTARADFLLGMTAANELVGVNLEWAGEASSAYVVLGAYQAKTGYEIDNMTGYAGYRRYLGGSFAKNTYFGGFFLGDVDGGATYNRFGAGGELGYQWLTEHLRVTAQAGMAIVGEASGTGAPKASDPKPQPLLGVSVSLRY